VKTLLLFISALALSTGAATATPITYSTVGSQLCVGASGCGVATQTIGGVVSITYNPIASSTVDANPVTFGSFGQIVVACVGGGTACANTLIPAGLTLYIQVTQTAPTGGIDTIPGGMIPGSLSGTFSSAVITWPGANTVNIGGINYSIFNNPLALVPPSVNGGITSIQAVIATPEPSSYALLSAGILSLGILRRRKRV
jgi:hypothetical protein